MKKDPKVYNIELTTDTGLKVKAKYWYLSEYELQGAFNINGKVTVFEANNIAGLIPKFQAVLFRTLRSIGQSANIGIKDKAL
jgi:hypothetical protein